MPVVSKAQNAAMHAAAEGRSTLGIPKSVGQDFVSASHGMKVGNLPTRVSKRNKALATGRVSAKASRRMAG